MLKQKKSNTKIPVNKMSYAASISSKNLNLFFKTTDDPVAKAETNVIELSKEDNE